MMLGRFFAGLWLGLDVLRKILHLVLLLVVFGFVVGALGTSIPHIAENSALVIAPRGEIVEQLTGDPIDQAVNKLQGVRQTETLLWDMIDALEAAAEDKRINAVVLDLNDLAGGGQPTLAELTAAIRKFRDSGKKVIAHSTYYSQAQYYVASVADEIYMDPMGFVLIDGYERYRTYYKDLFDKLGVEVNVFRVGGYKSAPEVYERSDMSAADREDSLQYLNALWLSWRTAVAEARGLTPDDISAYVANSVPALVAARGDTGKVALDAKLVTGLKSSLDVERRIAELVGTDTPGQSKQKIEEGESDAGESFNSTSLEDYVRVVEAEKRARGAGKPKVGVVVASGEILDGSQPPGTIGGESTANLIREARRDEDVKAIVIRVDSPGGSVLASEQIYREVRAAQANGKPVLVSMGDVAASGGYYIAASADEIWAHPATITGSIGIWGAVPTFKGTLGKIGVNVDGVGTTSLSGQMRLDRGLGEDAKKILQLGVERGYEEFLARVAEGRDKTRDEVDAVAQGRIWVGAAAKDLGLVDNLGLFEEVVKAAAARAKIEGDYDVQRIEPRLSWAETLALNIKVWFAKNFLGDILAKNPLAQIGRSFEPVQREFDRWSRMLESRDNRYFYCFCETL